jgi:hypothetical protein
MTITRPITRCQHTNYAPKVARVIKTRGWGLRSTVAGGNIVAILGPRSLRTITANFAPVSGRGREANFAPMNDRIRDQPVIVRLFSSTIEHMRVYECRMNCFLQKTPQQGQRKLFNVMHPISPYKLRKSGKVRFQRTLLVDIMIPTRTGLYPALWGIDI